MMHKLAVNVSLVVLFALAEMNAHRYGVLSGRFKAINSDKH